MSWWSRAYWARSIQASLSLLSQYRPTLWAIKGFIRFQSAEKSAGHQDHTTSLVRVSAAGLAILARPPHPAPTFVDDRDTPLLSARDGRAGTGDLPDGGS